jgi:RNA polymerase sigma-70 factor (ECF subfamily)
MDASIHDEVHDLAQEVMSVLVQELPQFTPERPGSFRRWLREITLHRLQSFWRSRQRRPGSLVAELADPASDLNRQWDQEHDQYVLRRLLELLKGDFAPTTFLAFRRVVLDDAKPADVARELGLSVNAVLLAKSRVLSALRQEGRYLLD